MHAGELSLFHLATLLEVATSVSPIDSASSKSNCTCASRIIPECSIKKTASINDLSIISYGPNCCREPIYSICWQYSVTEMARHGSTAQAYRLLSLGADGRILIWQWNKLKAPLAGFELSWQLPGNERRVVIGGASMALQRGGGGVTDAGGSMAVVGTEGGRTFKCNLETTELSVREFAKVRDTIEHLGASYCWVVQIRPLPCGHENGYPGVAA